MASTSKAGEGSCAGANGASPACEGGSAAKPQPSTSRTIKRTDQNDILDIFISRNRPLETALAEPPVGLPKNGKFKLVACELGTTGRRLKDEICIIAAYAGPGKKFVEHIMPHGKLVPGARRAHGMRIEAIYPRRVLWDSKTGTKIKADTEISGIIKFLVWLASLKSPEEQIILLYHDPLRLMPIMLMQSILRLNLLPRFQSLVAGFSDNYALCHATCGNTFKTLSVNPLASVLLDEGSQSTRTSIDRATAIYNILEQLTIQGIEMQRLQDIVFTSPDFDVDCDDIESVMIQLACRFGRPVHTEMEAFRNLKELLQKQNTFRAVFGPMLRHGPVAERRRLTLLRRVLVDAGLLYDQVKDAWHDDKRAGLLNLFTPLEEVIKKEEIIRLVSIFVNFFDTEEIDELRSTSQMEDLYDSEEDRQSSPEGAGAFAIGEDCLDD